MISNSVNSFAQVGRPLCFGINNFMYNYTGPNGSKSLDISVNLLGVLWKRGYVETQKDNTTGKETIVSVVPPGHLVSGLNIGYSKITTAAFTSSQNFVTFYDKAYMSPENKFSIIFLQELSYIYHTETGKFIDFGTGINFDIKIGFSYFVNSRFAFEGTFWELNYFSHDGDQSYDFLFSSHFGALLFFGRNGKK